jgi:hypothetical protein
MQDGAVAPPRGEPQLLGFRGAFAGEQLGGAVGVADGLRAESEGFGADGGGDVVVLAVGAGVLDPLRVEAEGEANPASSPDVSARRCDHFAGRPVRVASRIMSST